MNAKELRIGNLILFNNKLSKVTFIREDGKIGVLLGEVYRENIYQIEPIPLTEDWLINVGFNKLGNTQTYYNTFQVRTYFIEQEEDIWVIKITVNSFADRGKFKTLNQRPLEYIHQLQNLYFALTGKELTINV